MRCKKTDMTSYNFHTDTELSGAEEQSTHKAVLFRDRVEAGAAACARGDFETALRQYDHAIQLDPTNHVLYSNRSAIYCKLNRFEDALRDAERAYDLKPSWVKAFFRKGHALKCMGEHVRALLSYATGLAREPKNIQLLNGLIECARQSFLKERFESVYEELRGLELESSPFVLISVIGQELLSSNYSQEAAQILECGVKIGSTSLKLRQSVLSSLSSAYWQTGDLDKAADYMQQDLAVATTLADATGEARAHSNLGMVYYSLGKDAEALEHYRHHLMLSLKTNDQRAAATVLPLLGQLYLRFFDFENALSSFQQCIEILRVLPPDQTDAMEIGQQLNGMGQVYAAKGDCQAAEECFQRYLSMAVAQKSASDQASAQKALGNTLQKQQRYMEAIKMYKDALKLAQQTGDKYEEGVLCGSLSSVYQLQGQWQSAKGWAQRQLRAALEVKEDALQGSACGNLGCVFQQSGDRKSALKLHTEHFKLAEKVEDKVGMMAAQRNLGSCLSLMEDERTALVAHKKELMLARELHDRAAEGLAHGHLAQVYSKLNNTEQALTHLRCHWNLVRESQDVDSQLQALNNMSQFLAKAGDHQEAIDFLDKYLMLAQERGNMEAEQNACSQLGKAHLALGNGREATRYFDQQLAICKDTRNHCCMMQAYLCLGNANAALGQIEEAMEMYKYHLALAHISSDASAKLEGMTQLGKALIKKRDTVSAVKVLGKALKLAKSTRDRTAEGALYGQLGDAYSLAKRSDKALLFYAQELEIFQKLNNEFGLYDTYGQIGEHYKRNEKVDFAMKAFEDQGEVARRLGDSLMESEALGRIGATCVQFSLFEEAAKSYEDAIKTLGGKKTPKALKAALNAVWSLAECHENLNLPLDAVRTYERYVLLLAESSGSYSSSTTSLALAHKKLGCLWLRLANFEESISSFKLALDLMQSVVIETHKKIDTFRGLAAALSAHNCRSEALQVLQQRADFSQRTGLSLDESRSLFETGCIHVLLKDFDRARDFFHKSIDVAKRIGDRLQLCRSAAALCSFERSLAQDCRKYLTDIASRSPNSFPARVAALEAHKLLAIYFLKMCEYNSAIAQLDKALGVAAALNRLDVEVELRVARAVTFWSLDRTQDALREVEVALSRAETSPMIDTEGHCLQLGFVPDLLGAVCILQMCILAESNIEEALVSCEKWRYWQMVANIECCGTVLRKQRPNYPTIDRIREAVRHVLSSGSIMISQMQLGSQLLFTWVASPSTGLNLLVTRVPNDTTSLPERSSNGAVIFPRSFDWRITSPDVKSVLDNRLDQIAGVVARKGGVAETLSPLLDCNNFVLVADPSSVDRLKLPKNSRIRFVPCLTTPSLRLNSHMSLPPQFLLPGFVCGPNGSKGLDSMSKVLGVDCHRFESLHKTAFLAKLSKSRCVHLVLQSADNKDGFVIRAVVPKSTAESDSEDDEHDCYLYLDDVMSVVLHGAVATLAPANESVPYEMLKEAAVAMLVAGIKSVLVCGGSVSTEFYEHFYKELMNGRSVLEALHSHKQWRNADVKVFGEDRKLPEKGCDLSRALRSLLDTPDECREAFRVLLHLVEKSLQRIHTDQQRLYTAKHQVRNKVGPEVRGWVEFLEAVGFELKTANEKEPMLHFPLAAHILVLNNASKVMHAFLGLPQNSLIAFSQLIADIDAAARILQTLESLSVQLTMTAATQFETQINRALYDKPGVHGLVASLGFDKLRTDDNGVTVKTIRMDLTRLKVDQSIVCLRALFYDCLIGYEPSEETETAKPVLVGSAIQDHVGRLKDLEITDLSGIETDVPVGGSLPRNSAKKKGSSMARKRTRARGKAALTGYASESELKLSRRRSPGVAKGYFSEDESRRNAVRGNESATEQSMSGEILETTARVLSVDERASPYSDLGDSCHDDEISDSQPLRTTAKFTIPHTSTPVVPSVQNPPFFVRTLAPVYAQRRPAPVLPQRDQRHDYAHVTVVSRPPPPPYADLYGPPRCRAPAPPPLTVRSVHDASPDAELLRSAACKILQKPSSPSARTMTEFGYTSNYAHVLPTTNAPMQYQASFI